MDIIRSIFDFAGSLICHQLPDRSLTSGGIVLPVCARDTGIYAGIFTASLFIISARRLKAQRPPDLPMTIVMVVLMIPMMTDGMLSYTGIITTNNTIRLFTGLLFGLPLPFFLVPAANYSIHGRNELAVLKKRIELIPVYVTGFLLCVLLLYGLVPYIAAGFVFFAGFLFVISRLVYTIFARIGFNRKWKLYGMSLLGTMSVLMLLFLLSSYVLQPLKEMLYKG